MASFILTQKREKYNPWRIFMTVSQSIYKKDTVLTFVSFICLFCAACSNIRPQTMNPKDAAFASSNPISAAAHEQIFGWEK